MSAPAAELELAAAARHLARGGLVAFPTESSWGLAADAASPEAVACLRRFKGRDADKPLSVLVGGPHGMDELAPEAPDAARLLAEHFWPGPLTLVVPGKGGLVPGVAREDGAIGLRCSPHPDAASLAQEAAARGFGPLTATSLNRSGESALTRRVDARAFCAEDESVVVLRGEECGGAPASTVLDCTTPVPLLLRAGALPRASLETLVGPLADPSPGPT